MTVPIDHPHCSDSPERARRASALLFGAVLLCATCGMVYELALIALGSYLLGNAVVQASIVLSVMVCAMGVGAWASKRLVGYAAAGFVVIELLLGLIGGLSVLALYAAFAWLEAYTLALVVLAIVIGILIGAEIPLLMALLRQLRHRRASDDVADLFAADYLGALVGGLLFPFLLLPTLGLLRGTLAIGAVNATVGAAVVLTVFRAELGAALRRGVAVGLAVVLVVLGVAWWGADSFEVTARQRLYAAPIVHMERTPYQEIVLTWLAGTGDTRLFLNGNLQFSSLDEYRYHETLVHPALSGGAANVLVLGGGDGLAVREVLKYPVARVTLVDLDPAMTTLARTDPQLAALNQQSLADPRVHLHNADAFTWLRDQHDRFDVVIADLPDPSSEATAKLYSVEMYALVERALAPGGRLVVQSTSPHFARQAYWSIGATLQAAGFAVTPYHVDVPSFGDWGFFLASRPGEAGAARIRDNGAAPRGPDLQLGTDETRFLTPEVLAATRAFPKDSGPVPVEVSTLLKPVVLDYHRRGWIGY